MRVVQQAHVALPGAPMGPAAGWCGEPPCRPRPPGDAVNTLATVRVSRPPTATRRSERPGSASHTRGARRPSTARPPQETPNRSRQWPALQTNQKRTPKRMRFTWRIAKKLGRHRQTNGQRTPRKDEAPTPVARARHLTKSTTSSSWTKGLLRNRHGVMPVVSNVVTILSHEPKWQGVLAYNEFTYQILKLTPPPWHADDMPVGDLTGPWTDNDAVRVAGWVARQWGLTVTPDVDEQAVGVVADRNRIHSVKDWLTDAEKKWDKKPRLDTWLIRLAGAADTPYVRAVSSMFMIGAVARIFEPGCKSTTPSFWRACRGSARPLS